MGRSVADVFSNLPEYLVQELDPDKNRVDRIVMAGAETENGPHFSAVDTHILRTIVGALEDLKFPVSEGFSGIAEGHDPVRADRNDIQISNVRQEFGGQDFLKMEDPADVVALCNIPVHNLSYGSNASVGFGGTPENYLRMQRSFSRSNGGTDTMDDWRAALSRVDPKFVFLWGGLDCHQIADLKTREHVSLSLNNGCNVLIRRDMLDDLTMKVHYLQTRSPLVRISSSLAERPDITHFRFSKTAELSRDTGKPLVTTKIYPSYSDPDGLSVSR